MALIVSLGMVTLLPTACDGGEEFAREFVGSDPEQVAATVNAMTEAISIGDGKAACELMTERGQKTVVRVARSAEGLDFESCEEAVPVLDEVGYDAADYRVKPSDVSIESESPDVAWANCNDRGGFQLRRIDDGWLVEIPFCVD